MFKICETAILYGFNIRNLIKYQSLEIVDRGSETQVHVTDKFNSSSLWGLTSEMMDRHWSSIVSSENTRPWPSVGLMLVHRLRRWPNIKLTLGERVVFVVSACETSDNNLLFRTPHRLAPLMLP